MSELFTHLEVRKVENGKTLKGSGSVVVAGVMKVYFVVLEGSKGVFVKLPSHQGKDKDGSTKWFNDVMWTDEDARDEFSSMVLDALNKQSDSPKLNEKKPPSKKMSDSGLPF